MALYRMEGVVKVPHQPEQPEALPQDRSDLPILILRWL